MVQSLYRAGPSGKHAKMFKHLQKCKVVIGDELHHLESQSWYNVFSKIPAPWRYGLSATPNIEGPGLQLLAMTGDIIVNILPRTLMEVGILATPRIWFATVEHPILPKEWEYQKVYKIGIVENEQRNKLISQIAWTFKQERRPFLVVIRHLRHGEILERIMRESGSAVEFVCGASTSYERSDAIRKISVGKLDGIIATNIFDEGMDIPDLRVVINASGGRGGGDAEKGASGRQTIQILGRGVRAKSDKHQFDYVDFMDFTHKYLAQASNDRLGTLRSEGYDDLIDEWYEYEPMSE
jgi:superfamily II DNA or RNA helicase